MPIFVFQFKVSPERGFHLTVKHAYAAVYVRAASLTKAKPRAHDYVVSYHWIISSVVTDGFEYNPVLHDLADEALALCRHAKQTGAAMGVSAVGFDPDGTGLNN